MGNIQMDQTIINWLLGGFGAVLGFLLNAIWQAVKDLQTADKELTEKVSGIELLVAGDYVKKDEYHATNKEIFAKLDQILAQLYTKQDRPTK